MQPDQPPSSNPPPAESAALATPTPNAKGLPPVQPPSGRHLVQMFVVPGAIVGGVVMLGLVCSGAFSYLFGFGQAQTAQGYIERLEDANTDVRWRAANDLVQVLKRDIDLACDPALALKLSDVLTKELDGITDDEKRLLERASKMSPEETKKAQVQLKARRDYSRFLAACLASMTIPAGVEPLKQMATATGNDPKSVAQTRRQAVWMLANLADNLKRWQALPAAKREGILTTLRQEAAGTGPRATTAGLTADYLEGKKDQGVIAALAKCADADDPDLRKYTAYALAIWEGSPAENELAEKTLVKLSRDDGHGVRIFLGEDD
jgi:hypothetical protein